MIGPTDPLRPSHWLVIGHRGFGAIYRYHSEGQAVQADYSLTQCNAPEEQISHMF
jgi:hypothetical protein